MFIQRFEFNPFQENTYVLYDDSRQCIIVDPGCIEKEEQFELTSFIEAHELEVTKLVNTHCHVDHVLGNAFIKKRYGVQLFIHPLEVPVLKAVSAYAPAYGFFQYEETTADAFIQEGEKVDFGKTSLQILFVPGHSPGHIAFYDESAGQLISGDVLFYNSIGRTDLPGGNFDVLLKSIREKLFNLPDDVTVYCGHGQETTIGFEKKTNPFCAIQ